MTRKVAFLRRDMYVAHQILKDIRTKMNDKHILCETTNNQDFNEFEFNLPYRTIEEFVNLENYLQNEKNQTVVTNYLSVVGGNSVEDTVRRMLRRLVTNEVASQFSWQGKKGKKSLQHLEIFKLMNRVLRSGPHRAEYTCKILETTVSSWFRQAQLRTGKKKMDV